jgi:hypothetical protein
LRIATVSMMVISLTKNEDVSVHPTKLDRGRQDAGETPALQARCQGRAPLQAGIFGTEFTKNNQNHRAASHLFSVVSVFSAASLFLVVGSGSRLSRRRWSS